MRSQAARSFPWYVANGPESMVEMMPKESAKSAYMASASATAADEETSPTRPGSESARKAASRQFVLYRTPLLRFCYKLTLQAGWRVRKPDGEDALKECRSAECISTMSTYRG